MKYLKFLVQDNRWVWGLREDGCGVYLSPFGEDQIAPLSNPAFATHPPVAIPGEYLWSPDIKGPHQVRGVFWYAGRYHYTFHQDIEATARRDLIKVCNLRPTP